MVSRSVMSSPSDLRRQLVEEVGVRARVDLALEELGGGAHRDGGHFPAQALLRPRGVELDLLLCGRDDARALAAGGALGLLHELVSEVLRMLDDLVGAPARLAHDGLRPVARGGELLLALLDRKSTRLNSSHSQISYAVFC